MPDDSTPDKPESPTSKPGGAALLDREAGDRRIWFRLVDPTLDRDGTITLPMGVNVERFIRNPVFCWSHPLPEKGRAEAPPESVIGKVLDYQQTEEALDILVEFAPEEINSQAETCYQLVKGGYLGAVSWCGPILKQEDRNIGGKTVPVIVECELWEASLVIVGSNPAARVRQMEAQLRAAKTSAAVVAGLIRNGTIPADMRAEAIDLHIEGKLHQAIRAAGVKPGDFTTNHTTRAAETPAEEIPAMMSKQELCKLIGVEEDATRKEALRAWFNWASHCPEGPEERQAAHRAAEEHFPEGGEEAKEQRAGGEDDDIIPTRFAKRPAAKLDPEMEQAAVHDARLVSRIINGDHSARNQESAVLSLQRRRDETRQAVPKAAAEIRADVAEGWASVGVDMKAEQEEYRRRKPSDFVSSGPVAGYRGTNAVAVEHRGAQLHTATPGPGHIDARAAVFRLVPLDRDRGLPMTLEVIDAVACGQVPNRRGDIENALQVRLAGKRLREFYPMPLPGAHEPERGPDATGRYSSLGLGRQHPAR